MRFVDDTLCKEEFPVTVSVATCKLPVPVAFVKFTPEKVETPETVRAPAKVELPFGRLMPPLGLSCNTLFALVPACAPSTVSALIANPVETIACRGERVSNCAVEVLYTLISR